jgi:threonine/homoserine/homoserine lactone efflux protein
LNANVKEPEGHLKRASSLLKGVATNLLNPNAYMFWLTIGGPRVLEGAQIHVSALILFVLGFYTMLVGSNIVVAVVVDKFKALVESGYYIHIVRILGVVLIVFALIFVREALVFFGVL